jgi:hypothetical protein
MRYTDWGYKNSQRHSSKSLFWTETTEDGSKRYKLVYSKKTNSFKEYRQTAIGLWKESKNKMNYKNIRLYIIDKNIDHINREFDTAIGQFYYDCCIC